LSEIDSRRVFAAHADAWQSYGRLLEPQGGGAAEFPGWRLMASGLSYAYLNTACVTDPVLADVSTARAWYAERGLPWGMIVPSGSPWPHGRRLLSQRLMAATPACFSGTPAPAGLILRRAGADDIETVVAVDNNAFGSDPAAARAWLGPLCRLDELRVVIGALDGEAVAGGYSTICDGAAGESLYIGGIGVVQKARRKGIAAALVSWLVGLGFGAGACFAHLQTDSVNAARLYRKLGFREFDGIDIYAPE
jgi:ribosomal protein S18 acetylase RimI-like enzyme